MALKTYLDLTNEVFVRLREDPVGSVADTSYSRLIGKFVNDAKAYVENAWTWNALVSPVSLALIADTRDYTLAINSDSVLVKRPDCGKAMAYDVTAVDGGFHLFEVPQLEMDKRRAESVTVFSRVATPTLFSVTYGAASVGISLLEYPTQVRNWSLWFKQPANELATDTDTVSVPWRPIVMYAKMLALHERGEEIGEPGNLAQVEADRILSDAIALDLKDRRWLVDAY